MNETLPHFLNLDGLVVNVDKILYIRESCTDKNCFITLQTGNSTDEIRVTGYTSNELFNLLHRYDALLRESKTQG